VKRFERRWIVAGAMLLAAAAAALAPIVGPTLYARMRTKRTVGEVVAELGPAAEARSRPAFERAGVPYPPRDIALIAFKTEKRLELWAPAETGWKQVLSWPVLGASGSVGPKLREGDRQVPEGSYRIASLNPNSRFHLSLELDYPNRLDRARALAEGREPGREIFVHGSDRSVGCLAIGDEAIEELFTLAARIGPEHVEVLIAPNDPGPDGELLSPPDPPPWLPELHASIRARLDELRTGIDVAESR
jgi:hypothetical protein